MAKIDNFDAAMQQFLNYRINTLLLEIDSNVQKADLSQSIDKLLSQANPALDKEAKEEITEKMQDLVIDYQHNILQKVYLSAFLDGLKFESKMREV